MNKLNLLLGIVSAVAEEPEMTCKHCGNEVEEEKPSGTYFTATHVHPDYDCEYDFLGETDVVCRE